MLQLNPAHTILWRSPTSVQFGADQPVAHLSLVTTATEHVIAALSSGVSDVSLIAIAHGDGMTTQWLEEVLTALGPALVPQEKVVPWQILIEGVGPTAEALTRMLLASGHSSETHTPDVVIVIGHHVLRPEQAGVWLRRDITHLPVVFGDSLVHIGPVITPGSGPCLHCVYLEHTAADPAWPALAAQLLGRKSHLETERLSGNVASIVSHLIDNASGPRGVTPWADRLHPSEGLHTGEAIVLNATSGRMTRVTYHRRPECACQALPQNVTPIASHRVENPAQRTKGKGVFWPA